MDKNLLLSPDVPWLFLHAWLLWDLKYKSSGFLLYCSFHTCCCMYCRVFCPLSLQCLFIECAWSCTCWGVTVCHTGSAILRIVAMHRQLRLLPLPAFIGYLFLEGAMTFTYMCQTLWGYRWWLCWVQSEQMQVWCVASFKGMAHPSCVFLFSGFSALLLSPILFYMSHYHDNVISWPLFFSRRRHVKNGTHKLLQFF